MNSATAKKSRRPSSRQAILQAAANLIAEAGTNHLTLDAVAARAGVSKGGLLYNFPNKQALLAAMIEQSIVHATAFLDNSGGEGAPAPAEAIQTLLSGRLSWLRGAGDSRAAHGMLAAMAERPALLEPIRRFQKTVWDKMKASGGDATGLWLVWLAAEGLLFGSLYQTSPLSAEERDRIMERMGQELGRLLTQGSSPS
jgi:AcrR family transcriptional regulator